MKFILLVLAGLGLAAAQVPGFGGCPEFETQPEFDMNKFLGTWYEAERYVNIFEAGTRCVKTNYTKSTDGRFLVANEIMNRFTSVKRVLEGEIRLVLKGSESKLNVKYPNLPIPYESQFNVLDTDYDSYAVMWSCSSLGIVNTQNAWILTRDKLPAGTVMQKAYGILDKYKLSRTFFVKTDQENCEISPSDPNKALPSEAPPAAAASSAPPAQSTAAEGFVSSSSNKKPAKKITAQKKGAASTGRDEGVVAESDPVNVKPADVKPVETVGKQPVENVVADQKVHEHVAPPVADQKVDHLVVDQKVEQTTTV